MAGTIAFVLVVLAANLLLSLVTIHRVSQVLIELSVVGHRLPERLANKLALK